MDLVLAANHPHTSCGGSRRAVHLEGGEGALPARCSSCRCGASKTYKQQDRTQHLRTELEMVGVATLVAVQRG